MIHKLKIFIQATDQSIHGLESYLQAFVPHMLKHFVHCDNKIVQTLQSEIESDIVAAVVHCGKALYSTGGVLTSGVTTY